MEDNIIYFKRKMYDTMLKWKSERNGDTALLIQGARRIGKSTIAEEFARNEYKSYILIDFSKVSKEVSDLFNDISDFCNAYNELSKFKLDGELYVSNVISYLIAKKNLIFQFIETLHYKDFGTFAEWKDEQLRNTTYFIDFDGVLIKNSGNFGKINWSNQRTLLMKNCDTVRKLQERGAQIVITTSRPKNFEELIYELLSTVGIKPKFIITGLNHAPRVLINDFALSNPFPSARAISLPRDGEICDYIGG